MDPLLPLVDHALRALAVSHGGVSLRRDERKGGRGGGKEGKEEGGAESWGFLDALIPLYAVPDAPKSLVAGGKATLTRRQRRSLRDPEARRMCTGRVGHS